ncbi:MAG: sulfide/dihydroorotate dehydrogenase-like FAD/NAD-binding protein [Syntrophomonadaceae bacterium]|nr:sulfide/dihydroorotate dehydrogenase-like FAD/NAD-binding protein [Syntrophomonadaceae bacterium]
MFLILNTMVWAPNIKQITISAPDIARKAQPGQFVMLRVNDNGERIPLSIVDTDQNVGTITLVFKESGKSTIELGSLEQGDNVLDLAGPLGRASEITKLGKVICVGEGVEVASIYPIARALKESGNEVVSIISADTKQNLILSQEMKEISDEIFIATEDGSEGQKGRSSDLLKQLLEKDTDIDLVMAIGSFAMMKDVSEITRPYKIPTRVSLHTIMVDGIGMCGSCRVSVDNIIKFACVDGPEFDGHLVDWNTVQQRVSMFATEEQLALEKVHAGGGCRCQK